MNTAFTPSVFHLSMNDCSCACAAVVVAAGDVEDRRGTRLHSEALDAGFDHLVHTRLRDRLAEYRDGLPSSVFSRFNSARTMLARRSG